MIAESREYRLTPLEVASGLVVGLDGHGPAVDEAVPVAPIAALEEAMLQALQRPPCLVSFSGGRDSSAVLAVATRLARRERLPLPIPATNRFPDAPASDESVWQERVVAHLRLDEWLRLDFAEELDCVGPVARRVLRRHGLLWPFNAHFHVPVLEAANRGSVLTGIGGDEVLGPSRWTRAGAVLGGRERPAARDVLRVGLALAPPALRRVTIRTRQDVRFPWLQPAAERDVLTAWAAEAASEPLGWAARLRWRQALRYLRVGLGSLERLAAEAGVHLAHPLASPAFSTSLARLPRSRRYADRTEAMRLLFGDVLPEDVLTRSTKSHFDEAFWNEHSRSLAERFMGENVDSDLVDPLSLKAEWTSARPDARSFTQLQALWLASGECDAGSAANRVHEVTAGGGQ